MSRKGANMEAQVIVGIIGGSAIAIAIGVAIFQACRPSEGVLSKPVKTKASAEQESGITVVKKT